MAHACAARYRTRNPRSTPLYRLFDTHFDEVRTQLIKRIYEVDPPVCPSCGSEMKVIALITEYDVIDGIYSRSDGIVAWRACIDRYNPDVRHHEDFASHLGLIASPGVFTLVARCIHPEETAAQA